MKKNHDKSRLKKTSKRKHRNARKNIYIYIKSIITIDRNKVLHNPDGGGDVLVPSHNHGNIPWMTVKRSKV